MPLATNCPSGAKRHSSSVPGAGALAGFPSARDQVSAGNYYVSNAGSQAAIFQGGPGYSDAGATASGGGHRCGVAT
ncbi:MAG: hypothetical protein ABSE73_30745 [Planctomycetota bacterium]